MQRRDFFKFLGAGVLGASIPGGSINEVPPAKDQEKPVEIVRTKLDAEHPFGSSVWIDGLQLQPGKILTIENKSGRWVSVFPPH